MKHNQLPRARLRAHLMVGRNHVVWPLGLKRKPTTLWGLARPCLGPYPLKLFPYCCSSIPCLSRQIIEATPLMNWVALNKSSTNRARPTNLPLVNKGALGRKPNRPWGQEGCLPRDPATAPSLIIILDLSQEYPLGTISTRKKEPCCLFPWGFIMNMVTKTFTIITYINHTLTNRWNWLAIQQLVITNFHKPVVLYS